MSSHVMISYKAMQIIEQQEKYLLPFRVFKISAFSGLNGSRPAWVTLFEDIMRSGVSKRGGFQHKAVVLHIQ
jgi:hypothetical protein